MDTTLERIERPREHTTGTGVLKGKSALVTGSTSGIGLAIARALAAEGANVMLNGFGEAAAIEGIRAGLAAEFGIRAGFDAADISQPEQVRAMVARAAGELGGLDILINNAGIQHTAAVEEFPDDRWDAVLATNLTSNFHAIKAALPAMRLRGWGRIVNIASVHGMVASVNKAAYVAAKHGVLGLTRVVALETARTGITCNAICPGWVLTPLVQKQIDDLARREMLSQEEARRRLVAEKQPAGDFATPEQIAALAVFLCTPAAAQIRGAAITVDGGWTSQ